MAQIEAEYLGDLRVECKRMQSGAILYAESRVEDYGRGVDFSPTELVATALGSCALNTIGIYAHKWNIDVRGARIHIDTTYGEKPLRIARIDLAVIMPPKGYSEKERKSIERCVKSCPVHNSLSADMEQNFIFKWLDDEK